MARISNLNNLISPTESAVTVMVDNNETRKITLTSLRNSLLTPATTTEFGAVKVGRNLSIDSQGVLNAADPQVVADWTAATGPSRILNKPTLSTVATSGSYTDLTNKPVIPPAQIPSDWAQTDELQRDFIRNKPAIPNPQIQSDWAQTNVSSLDFIKNKPSIPAAQVPSDWNAVSGVARILNKPVLFSGNYSDLSGAPTLATVATTGNYADLTNKPTIPQVTTRYVATPPTSSVGATGDVPGLISATPLHTYVCYGTYDGVSNIWAKSPTVGDTW
ncbi:hypothetical protein EBU71_01320 [bacterium]|nr:hypothetical protein [Candidatus Elulimicrobium humile]